MSLLNDLKILYSLTLSPVRGNTHAERLESFYSKQATDYDAFRDRLLQGRREMYRAAARYAGLDTANPPKAPTIRWLDMGGGTAANIEHLSEFLPHIAGVEVVDLSGSLLKIAGERIVARRWSNVRTVQADVTDYAPPHRPVDVVTFSYSLTMIPPWHAAIERALALLRPGGVIGVVDFYVSHKHPRAGMVKHGWTTRTVWPAWFGFDNVFVGCDHIAVLQQKFQALQLIERRARLPYLPFGRAPYYLFIGRKPE